MAPSGVLKQGTVLITVVVPTCKRPKFLSEALDSIEAARLAVGIRSDQFEVIVVDDGHDEETQGVCDSFGVSQVISIDCQRSKGGPRAGPSACRDQGIRQARGEFIYLLDDDDAFLPSRFKNSIRLLAEEGYDVVLEPSLREYVKDPKKPSYITGPYGNPENAFHFLMTGGERSHITPGATSFRRKLYEQVGGYDDTLRYGEDGELLLRLCLAGRVALVGGDPVVRIAIHEDNSSRPDRLHFWQNIKSLARLYRKMRSGPWPEETAFVKTALAGKFDFALSEIRKTAPSYPTRLADGIAVLRQYDWRCVSLNNLKSIVVWLARGRAS